MKVHAGSLVASQANTARAHAAGAKATSALQRSFFVFRVGIMSAFMILYCTASPPFQGRGFRTRRTLIALLVLAQAIQGDGNYRSKVEQTNRTVVSYPSSDAYKIGEFQQLLK